MPAAARLTDALTRCEAELQQIAAEAMAGGDYPAARLGMELAEGLADQRSAAGLTGGTVAPRKPKPKPRAATPGKTAKKPAKSSPKPSAPRATAKAYPKFVRDGDKLVKIGWSKRSKEEYTHKAPRSAVEAVAAHLRKHTRPERLFTIDDVTPVPDPDHNGDLPAYQVYMAIAWLRSLGVMFKHSRDGYSVDHPAIQKKPLAQAWKRLPFNLT